MTVSKEINQSQQTKFLRQIQFFSDFDDNELKQFLAVSKWLKVPAQTLIIKEGATEMVFYILVRGRVSIYKTLPDGDILELTTLETGACFGEMALVSECKRTAGVKTTIESYLLMVDPKIVSTSSVFLQLKFYRRFCEILVSRLEHANRRVANQAGGAAQVIAERQGTPLPSAPSFGSKAASLEATISEGSALPAELPAMPETKGRVSPGSLKPRLQDDRCLAINPVIASQLTSFLQRQSDGDQSRLLADLIMQDPVLSARVLQVANSPFYRRTCPVLSIPHAMVIVGAQPVREVVSSVVAENAGALPFSGFQPLTRQFWQHAVVVGRIAELLKEVIRLDVGVDIYLAGLFHDLGMLALDFREPAFYPQLLRPGSELGCQLEKSETEYIGASHSTAGRWLGEYLGLPQAYLEVIRLHHQPEKANSDIALPVALVHLADQFAAERGICLGARSIKANPADSFAWVLIREQHRPFVDVNLADFLTAFSEELEKNWQEITGGASAAHCPPHGQSTGEN